MSCPDIGDVAAKAIIEIQDTADLLLLDLLEGRECGVATTRFAAIQQYASRAIESLAYIAEEKPATLPPEWAARLRERHRRSLDSTTPGLAGLQRPKGTVPFCS